MHGRLNIIAKRPGMDHPVGSQELFPLDLTPASILDLGAEIAILNSAEPFRRKQVQFMIPGVLLANLSEGEDLVRVAR